MTLSHPRPILLCLFLVPALLQAQAATVIDAAFLKGDPKAVMLACAERAISLNPGDGRVRAQAGRAFLVGGERAKAEEAFRTVNVADGESSRWMGQGWIEAGDMTKGVEALSRLQTAVWAAPTEVVNGAVLLMDAGHPREAGELMNALPGTKVENWEDYLMPYGRACLRAGRQDLAAVWYAKAVMDHRKEGPLWGDMALALQRGGAE